ncbi:MAG: NAD(P)/FAD-dependent oxidoreductase [Anaerolineales bacterium]|nr:NAD(P)/FAD-dependent oxidoreductase [Anaerolineales bacterium]
MEQYVIVGNGIAGITAAQTIVRADPAAEVHIFGAEPYPYYRRPILWEFIAGQIEQEALFFRPTAWYTERGIRLHLGVGVTALNPQAHSLTLADGSSAEYDRLLLATGCRPFIPPFEGVDKKGVYTLRTIEDAISIKEHSQGISTAAIIGGGLLGIETARALTSLNLDVSVIEFMPHLLPLQLDAEGAQALQSLLESMGMRILTGAATEAILGDELPTGVRIKDGRVVDAELVVISTGIRPRIELAREAGMDVNRGVVVDGQLRTSAADIYAAGDVAEFEGTIYGIIPAAIDQARVAAANMVTSGSATYTGTIPATTLKIAGIDLTSLGEATVTGDEFAILRKVDAAGSVYRRLTLRDGKVVGAILLGDTQSVRPVKQLIATGRDVSAYGERLLDEGFDLMALAQGKLVKNAKRKT